MKKNIILMFMVIFLIVFSHISIVESGFPSAFIGFRDIGSSSSTSFATYKFLGKFQMNNSKATPNNISVYCSSAVTTRYVSMAIYSEDMKIVARTETVTMNKATKWLKATVNWTLNSTCLWNNRYYYISAWMQGIATGNIFFQSDTGLGIWSQSNTSYYRWWDTKLTDFSLIDSDDNLNIFVNYTVVANPDPPNNFVVSNVYGSDNSLSLTWNKGLYALKTRIQYKTGSNPTTVTDGTNCYNDTGTTYTLTGLTGGEIYYFSAWSWNTTFASYSLTYVSGNKRVYIKPIKPTDFIGNNVSYTRNLFAWIKGINATVTRIQYNVNTTYPTTVSTGTNTYNLTNTYNDDSGLLKNSSYYYSAWSFNSTNGLWSSDYTTLKINTNDTIYNSGINKTLHLYEFIGNAYGLHEYNYNSTDINVWANYSTELHYTHDFKNVTADIGFHFNNVNGNWYVYFNATSNIFPFENIVNAIGNLNYSWVSTWDNDYPYPDYNGNWSVWANYTGTGGGCSGIVWVNYSDENLSFNVSVNKTDNTNTSTYFLTDMLLYLGSTVSLDNFMILLIYLFALMYFIFNNKTNDLFLRTKAHYIFIFSTIVLLLGVEVGEFIVDLGLNEIQRAMLIPFLPVFIILLWLTRKNDK